VGTKKRYVQRMHSAFEKNISRHVRIKTQDNKVYEGYIEKVDDEHVYLAVPKTKRAAGMVKTNGNWFRRRHFRRIVLPLALIAALFLL
jgi:ribosome maturation factor RimP